MLSNFVLFVTSMSGQGTPGQCKVGQKYKESGNVPVARGMFLLQGTAF